MKKKFTVIYTIFVFIALAAFDNIIIGLFPPLFQSISKDLNVQNVGRMGIISALNILTTALSSVYWGYLSGRFKRKKLIIIGTLIWVISVFLTASSESYLQLLLYQILTGVGLGCIASIGFSVLTDSIPYQYRGLILSLWGMTQGLGGIIGALMASLLATHSWRMPFELVGFIGLLLMILYLFVKEPSRGESEPELKRFLNEGNSYNYHIEAKHIIGILFKRSNIYLFLQAFFMNIATGSLIWLPVLYQLKIQQQGFDMKTAMIASGYLYAIFQFGGMTSAFFGHLGDKIQKKTFKGRALLTAAFVFLTMPFYILMFIIPMEHLSLPLDHNPFMILISLLKQIIVNPWILLLFVFSFIASSAQSANTPNWLALITDVNLPEHRGTAFSVANLSNSLGRTLGNIGVAQLLNTVLFYTGELNSYIITLSLLQVFLIPSALCYVFMAKKNVIDIKMVKQTLRSRAEENLTSVNKQKESIN